MSNILRSRALPIAAALAISTAALMLFIREASAQEATSPAPETPAAAEAPPPADAPAPPAATTPPPSPDASTTPAPASASGEPKPNDPELPEVKIIQEKEEPKPVEEAAPKPKNKPAPVAGNYDPAPAPKKRKVVTPSAATASSSAAATSNIEVPAGITLATDGNAAAASTANAIDNGGTGGNPAVDYALPNASSATKTMTPIMETPFSVKTIPQAVIQDQQIVRLEEALENVPGVRRISHNANLNDEFLLRGFGATTTYRDGVRENARGHSDFANIERVEVLKGPGSILYGQAEPGGIINFVTKKPQAFQHTSVQQQIGSWDFYRTTIDTTGPVTTDKSLLYRLNVAYENADSFRDWEDSNRFFIAPVVRWNASEQTQVNFEFEYLKDHATPIPRLPELYAGRDIGTIAPVPRSTNLGDPLAFHDVDRILAGVNWSHKFDENWTLRHRFTAQFEDIAQYNIYITSPADPDYVDETVFMRGLQDVRRSTNSYFNSVDLTGAIVTGLLKHTVVVGGDYFKEKDRIPRLMDIQETPNLNIDIYNPRPLPGRPFIDPATNRSPNTDSEWYGLYAQDQLELPYGFHALAGVRYDHAITDFDLVRNGATEFSAGSDNDKYSPRYGLLWRPIEQLSLYGSYTENFGRPNETDEDVGPLPPELAEQWEAGVKTEIGLFSASLAWFELTKMNIAGEDQDGNTIVVGEAVARGIEFEVGGEILPGLRITGGYAYMPFAEITKDSKLAFDDDGNPIGAGLGLTGNRLWAVPLHQGSLWGTYEFEDGDWKGLKLGAGIVAAGEVFNDLDNTIVLPSYWTMNLSAGYEFNVGLTKYTAQINVDNVLDEAYYNYGTQFGAPRSFRAALRAEF